MSRGLFGDVRVRVHGCVLHTITRVSSCHRWNTQRSGKGMILTRYLYFHRNRMSGRCIRKDAGSFSLQATVSGNSMKTS